MDNERFEQLNRLLRVQQQQQRTNTREHNEHGATNSHHHGNQHLDNSNSSHSRFDNVTTREEASTSPDTATALLLQQLHQQREGLLGHSQASIYRDAMPTTSSSSRQQQEDESSVLQAEINRRQRLLLLQQRAANLNNSSSNAESDMLLLQRVQHEQATLRHRLERLESLAEQLVARMSHGNSSGMQLSATSSASNQLLLLEQQQRERELRNSRLADVLALEQQQQQQQQRERPEDHPRSTASVRALEDRLLLQRLQQEDQQRQRQAGVLPQGGKARKTSSKKKRTKDSTAQNKGRGAGTSQAASVSYRTAAGGGEDNDSYKSKSSSMRDHVQHADSMRQHTSVKSSSTAGSANKDASIVIHKNNKNGSSSNRCFPMAETTDRDSLSTFQVLIRECLEYFVATPQDVTTPVQGRKRSIRLGQIGIRCTFCSHLLLSQRLKGAVNYPSTLLSVYQTAQNIAGVHLLNEQSPSCQCVPDHVRQALLRQRAQREPSRAGKMYWMNACQAVGIVEDDGALWLQPTTTTTTVGDPVKLDTPEGTRGTVADAAASAKGELALENKRRKISSASHDMNGSSSIRTNGDDEKSAGSSSSGSTIESDPSQRMNSGGGNDNSNHLSGVDV